MNSHLYKFILNGNTVALRIGDREIAADQGFNTEEKAKEAIRRATHYQDVITTSSPDDWSEFEGSNIKTQIEIVKKSNESGILIELEL